MHHITLRALSLVVLGMTALSSTSARGQVAMAPGGQSSSVTLSAPSPSRAGAADRLGIDLLADLDLSTGADAARGESRTGSVILATAEPDGGASSEKKGPKIIFDASIGATFPLNEPKVGLTKRVQRKTGVGGHVGAAVPVFSGEDWEVFAGGQFFAATTSADHIDLNPPKEDKPIDGGVTYYGGALIVGADYDITSILSLKGYVGGGGAAVDYKGSSNGINLAEGSAVVPALRVGVGSFVALGGGVKAGVGVNLTQTGEFGTDANSRITDLTVGLALSFDLYLP